MKEQGDEQILEKLSVYLKREFPRLKFGYKVPLRELFPEPQKVYLKTIWKYGHADIPVYRHGDLVCIIEIGGSNHFRDKKQRDRDKRKDFLCNLNRIGCLRLSNNFLNYLNKKISLKLLKKYFYGEVR